MKWQVVGNEPEAAGDLRPLEQVTPLRPMTARRMLQEDRDTLPRLLEINAVVLTLEVQMNIAADRRLDRAVRPPPPGRWWCRSRRR